MTGREAIQASRHFSLSENWGDPDLVHSELIFALDNYRHYLNKRLHISPRKGAVYADRTGHTDESWHYIIGGRNDFSMAADVFPEDDILHAWITAMRFPFSGIGIYPYWEYPSKHIKGGLHLDVRIQPSDTPRAMWWHDGEEYRSLSEDGLDEVIMILTIGL